MNRLLDRTRNLSLGLLLSGALVPALISPPVGAAVSPAVLADYTLYPVISTESATPEVMLAMSKDHQYFFKAYNDYSDLDGDGTVERTFDPEFLYYGYFDPKKCYEYDNGAGRFEPGEFSVTEDNDGDGKPEYYCTGLSSKWSGNFLNWATMTRMDVVRKILYGGKRSTDTSSRTVLERAYLPHDAHSFAKYYNGTDIPKLTPWDAGDGITLSDGDGLDEHDEGITICNTTHANSGEKSQTTTRPPLMRVVRQNRQLWSANERWQCTWESENGDNANSNNPAQSGIEAEPSDPPDSLRLSDAGANGEFIVRVEVCEDDPSVFDPSENLEKCKRYPDGNLKPTGLLQQYGEQELVHFGLLTGSYQKNISGGVLRKNVGNMADEINILTDGTFKSAPATGGIINTLDRLRIYGYRYDNGTYLGGAGDDCNFQLNAISEGNCTSWGNPLSEIFLEALRYFAGKSPTPAFLADDTGHISGLTTASWTDPLSTDNACAPLSVVTFNASVNSYDDDQMSGISDLGASSSIQNLTKAVGDGEGITGNPYFIGRNGTDNDEFCTGKTITSLGDAEGVCPEAPTVQGSYLMAGAAHYARTNDIRSDLEGSQTVRTFAVALATNVPKIVVPHPVQQSDGIDNDGDGDIDEVGEGAVTILPAYRLVFNNGGGTLVDFKVVEPHAQQPAGVGPVTGLAHASPFYTAKFYINWEDSEQGGDFDQDEWGILRYEMFNDGAGWKIAIETDAIAASTINGQLFGFITSGTTQDGFHAYSGIINADFPGVGATDTTGVPACTSCNVGDPAAYHTFTLGGSSAGLLEQPLYYAGKWGGFTDENGNGIPDLQSEWDRKDTTGAPVPDGVPDNFFFVTNPAALEQSLTQVFETITEKTASGTAAAVVANTQTGSGAAYQALYEPIRKDSSNREVKWIGTLHALWIDEFGLLREDAGVKGKLEGYQTDKVVRVFFDEADRKTKIERFDSSDDTKFTPSGSTVDDLLSLQTIWNAREELSDLADPVTQRVYTAPADSGRHIFTWIDSDGDAVVDAGEQQPFVTSTFTSGTNYGFLNLINNPPPLSAADTTSVDQLVRFIRGEGGIAGLRNRTVDFDGPGPRSAEVMRLGDIIHSTPTPVQAPAEAFDLLFGDLEYADFRTQYSNRRQVVYVGGNDGMLHAFNAGFFNPSTKTFDLTRARNSYESAAPTAHPLGTELWAYVPRNLLPHLKWLEQLDYTHVYYVDAKPRVFDAKIFPDDSIHPGGWGTVLVVGFRLGGGAITTDTAADGLGAADSDSDTSDDVTMRSAYAVLDITNPEQPPTVLAELTAPNLGFTTSFPTVVHVDGSDNKWYLVVGSGPTELGSATSTQNARIYAYEMKTVGGVVQIGTPSASGPQPVSGFPKVLAEAGSFVGDPLTVDWDLDRKADAVYFGTASGTPTSSGGRFYKLDVGENPDATSWPAPTTLLDTNQPFLTQPVATVDEKAKHWVFASTGRFFVNADRGSTEQQTLYGFIDGAPNSFSISNPGSTWVNTTDAQILTDGSVSDVIDPDGDTINTFTELQTQVEEAGGWFLNYVAPGSPSPSQRGVTTSALIGGILFNPAFTPSEDLCTSEGESVLYGLFYKTGTALPSPAVFGTEACGGGPDCPSGEFKALSFVPLGAGLASSPSIHAGSGLGQNEITVVEQTSTGAIVLQEATTAGGVRSAEVSWREYLQLQ